MGRRWEGREGKGETDGRTDGRADEGNILNSIFEVAAKFIIFTKE